MTYKTLSFIHNLLVNVVHTAALKVKWQPEDYNEKYDLFARGIITENDFNESKATREELLEEHSKAAAALADFERKEWR